MPRVSRAASWHRLHEGLPSGTVLRYEATIAGWALRADLVLTGLGTMRILVNGEPYGDVMMECTFTQGRRRYLMVLKRLSRPRQLTFPV